MTDHNRQEERFKALWDALTPENRETLKGILLTLKAQEDRQKAAIPQAISHATLQQVQHGAALMEDTIRKYRARGDFYSLAGLAFIAGVVEGKQQERARRKHSATLRAIRKAHRAAEEASSPIGSEE